MNEFDSGKTTVSKNLAQLLGDMGFRVEYFKPLSGHNYWFHYEHTQRCLERGELVSYDAWRLAKVTDTQLPLTVINPIHNLFVPATIDTPNPIFTNSLAQLGWDSVLVMKRITQVIDDVVENRLLVAEDLIRAHSVVLSTDEMQRLTSGNQIIPIKSLEEAQAFQDAVYEGVLNEALAYVEESADVVIIESFNNSLWPWEGLHAVDAFLHVGPGHMFLYAPEKMKRAVDYAKRHGEPIRSVTGPRVYDLLKPLRRIRLVPGALFTTDILDVLFSGQSAIDTPNTFVHESYGKRGD